MNHQDLQQISQFGNQETFEYSAEHFRDCKNITFYHSWENISMVVDRELMTLACGICAKERMNKTRISTTCKYNSA